MYTIRILSESFSYTYSLYYLSITLAKVNTLTKLPNLYANLLFNLSQLLGLLGLSIRSLQ